MSEVTAEQLREVLGRLESITQHREWSHFVAELAPMTMDEAIAVVEVADLLADRPLTLAALQAGAKEHTVSGPTGNWLLLTPVVPPEDE